MKTLSLLPVFISLCVAVAVPSSNDPSSSHLQKRAQKLTNPDNEPDFEDPVSKSKVPKSRVLEFDGTDDPASKRWFDWDESCSNENDRKKILAAFNNVMDLSKISSDFLTDLQKGLPKQNTGTKVDNDNRKYIMAEDPAFTQMFNAEDIRISFVKDSFDLIPTKMKSFDGRNDNKPPAVRFICDPKGEVKTASGDSYCGTGDTAAQAVTNNAANDGIIEAKYSFQKSASIVFCPVFFNDDKFPNIDAIAGLDDNTLPKTLDKVDCRERILMHEFLHLRFIRNFSSKVDFIGFEKAAKTATKGWGVFKINCENYAWYSLYSYWNNYDAGCKKDAWPAGVAKPITK